MCHVFAERSNSLKTQKRDLISYPILDIVLKKRKFLLEALKPIFVVVFKKGKQTCFSVNHLT